MPSISKASAASFLVVSMWLLTACCEPPEESVVVEEIDFHDAVITIDTHIDIPNQLGTEAADPSIDGPMQVDFPKMREGGLDAGFFIVYVAQTPISDQAYEAAYQEAQAKFDAIERMLIQYPEEIGLAITPAALRQRLAEGRLAAMIGVENAFPLGPNLEHLNEFYQRGARYISLTHFGNNDFADSSGPRGDSEGYTEPVHNGLSELGIRLIQEMNDLGIMVDVSHTSKATTLQAAEYSVDPIIASHSGVKALYDHPRNLSDEEIIAIADTGGVVQVVAFDSYMRELSEENKAAMDQIREELGLSAPDAYKSVTQEKLAEQRNRTAALNEKWPRASVSTLVDSIDYVVQLVGIDHVGIASDFGGGGGVESWDNAAETRAVTNELVARGYSWPMIEKIWGGNLLRVWDEVQANAESRVIFTP